MRSGEVTRRHFHIRRYEAADLLESFMVSAISSLLLIRFVLKVTGYPQLGNAQFHIAHLLWGGLLMLASIVMLLVWMTRLPLHLASVLGGVGFGVFIDELGKFITSDNDYFYQPTIALIYVFFVLLLLAFRALSRYSRPTARSNLVNALELAKEAVVEDLDHAEKHHALHFLGRCDPADPVVQALTGLVARSEATGRALPVPAVRLRSFLNSVRRSAGRRPWFTQALYLVVVVCLAAALAEGVLGLRPERRRFTTASWGQFFSYLLIALLVIAGFLRMPRSRLAALRFFNRAVLVSIFVTQVFAFYREQLKAIVGLLISIALWLFLRTAIREEERKG